MTTGPYAYFRHPDLRGDHLFHLGRRPRQLLVAGVLAWAELITAGAFTRMHIEEHMLVDRYPEYADYKAASAA